MTFEQAVGLQRQGRLAEAAAVYEALLKRQPRHRGALLNLGLISVQRGDLERAEQLMAKAVRLDPRDAAALSNLALVQCNRGRLKEALQSCERALALRPAYPEALNNRGLALAELGRVDEALASFDRALDLAPDFVDALGNRASALARLERLEEALDCSARALALAPGSLTALYNRGIILHVLNRPAEALACFDRILAVSTGSPEVHWSASLSLLLAGDFRRGWREYESRWHTKELGVHRRSFPKPRWLGDGDLDGRTILLHAEQGLGDSVMFARYAPLVAARGGRVILEVQAPLMRLLAQVEGVKEMVATGDPLPDFDTYCPLGSLPLAFRTDLATIPAPPAYLRAQPEEVARWRERLGPATRRRVGLVWSGNPQHRNDSRRSIPLIDLLPLVSCDVELIGLQRDLRSSDRQALEGTPAIRNFDDELRDFADTAALMSCLDLVISIDSAPAHLAGALGLPTWLLLPVAGDWQSVVAQVAEHLRQLPTGAGPTAPGRY